jgi:mono/diheme cytochrome c family protein
VTAPIPLARRIVPLLAGVLVSALAACGGEIEVPDEQASLRKGAELFNERCSGCHTLEAANSYGSKPEGQLEGGERTNGPNFNVRKVGREDALFAIRNGGFSGAIMPANVVVGRDAELVADFLAKYSGRTGGGSP